MAVEHLVDIYVVYALSFLALGLALYLSPRDDHETLPFARDLRLLAAFGLLHGLNELLVAWHLAHPGDHPSLHLLLAGVLIASYLPLLEFGRRTLHVATGRRLAFTPVAGVVTAGIVFFGLLAADPMDGMALAGRYFIGLPGALLTGYSFLRIGLRMRREREWHGLCLGLCSAGVGFLFYGLFAGLVVPAVAGLPVLLSEAGFIELTGGVPVQLLRTACAVVMAGGLVRVVSLANRCLHRREQEAVASLARLNADLEARVSERTAALQEVIDQLGAEVAERKKAEDSLTRALEELQAAKARQDELLEIAHYEQRRLATLLSAMNIGILFEDREGRVEFVNPAFLRLWAIPEKVDIIGMPAREVLEHSTHRFARPNIASRHVLQVLDANEISERFEIDLYDGRILTQLSYPVTASDGTILGRLWLYEDITHERQTAQQLLYLAEHDPLTGLYNRHRFQKDLEQRFNTARRAPIRFALYYFDLDEFKYINDTFGHSAGDTVLSRVASEVGRLVRSSEVFARLGGDEFAVLSILGENEQPEALSQRIISAVSSIPLRLRGTNIRLTTSVGVAIFPEHGSTAEELVAHADAAMYRAKEKGKNTWSLYDPDNDISESALQRMTMGRMIEWALQDDGLEIHYQGVYRPDGRLSHIEALMRIRGTEHPEHLIMPGQIIPVAERSGQIVEIDRAVIRRCIQDLAADPAMPPVAVNISGKSFDQASLPDYIGSLLQEYGVEPERLLVELTETEAVSDLDDAQRFIEAIRKIGCEVCMDDFGSGFSTFVYLKYLDVDILKIDGLFIRDLPTNNHNQTFVRAMLDITRGMNKKAVAEFVEDQATVEMLIGMGIDLLQGYHFGRPVPDYRLLLQEQPDSRTG